jgi:hypothetical protein
MAFTAALPCAGPTITDGDTLKQGGAIYRLWGIDSPEAKQVCPMVGRRGAWPRQAAGTDRRPLDRLHGPEVSSTIAALAVVAASTGTYTARHRHVVVQELGKQNALPAVLTFDEALHLQLRSSVVEILTQLTFSHSLGHFRTS